MSELSFLCERVFFCFTLSLEDNMYSLIYAPEISLSGIGSIFLGTRSFNSAVGVAFKLLLYFLKAYLIFSYNCGRYLKLRNLP